MNYKFVEALNHCATPDKDVPKSIIYHNDMIELLNNESLNSQIQISENHTVNILLYANNVVILAASENELQKKVGILDSFCQKKKETRNER